MNFWGENIRFLRKQAGLSQEALAKALNMTRVKLNAHENAKTINPTADDLILVSDYFNVSIDHLIRIKLSSHNINLVDTKKPSSDLHILTISVDENNDEYVDYLPIKATAGYSTGHRDPQFIADLPKYKFPDLPKGKTFRLFPTTGDSMIPIPEGSDVLAYYVEDWYSIKPDTLCVIVMRGEQELVFKQLTILPNDRILLKSLNKLYKPYEVRKADVLEIWVYERYMSRTIPIQQNELDEIKALLLDMQQELQKNNA